MIYLDNAATTPIHPYVWSEMKRFMQMSASLGNPSSIHSAGRAAKKILDDARLEVAGFFNASPSQIIFTSGGTESNRLAIAHAFNKSKSNSILTTEIEHDSADTISNMIFTDIHTTRISKNEAGELVMSVKKPLVETGAVSVMLRNNEVPIVWDDSVHIIEQMHEHGWITHADAVQFAPHEVIDVNGQHKMFDSMSISGHKMYAPKGIGALFVRNPEKNYLYDASKQEFGIRRGTENMLGIVGLAAACRLFKTRRNKLVQREKECAEAFENCFWARLRERGVDDVRENGLCNGALASYMTGEDAETLVLMCDARGVAISAGAACNSHESKPSRVLKAIGLTDAEARQTIRVSFSAMQEPVNCGIGGEIVADCIADLKGK